MNSPDGMFEMQHATVDHKKVYYVKHERKNDMKEKMDALLANYPNIDTAAMGFPRGWENEPIWNR